MSAWPVDCGLARAWRRRLLNPYGLELHRWLWHSWAGAPPEITEWAPPLPGKPVFWPLVTLLVVTVACLAGTRRRRDWTQIVILALVAWQACLHLRHIAFLRAARRRSGCRCIGTRRSCGCGPIRSGGCP